MCHVSYASALPASFVNEKRKTCASSFACVKQKLSRSLLSVHQDVNRFADDPVTQSGELALNRREDKALQSAS